MDHKSTTQRLAPMLRWAAECERIGMIREAGSLTVVGAILSTENNPARVAHGWARVFLHDFHGRSPAGWAYAIAYVLLTEETG